MARSTSASSQAQPTPSGLARCVRLPQLPAGFGALTAAAVAALTVCDMTKGARQVD